MILKSTREKNSHWKTSESQNGGIPANPFEAQKCQITTHRRRHKKTS